MPATGSAVESPRALFERHLERIEDVLTWVSRRFAMSADEAEEFRSWAHLKLIEDDYRVLRAFSGRSSIATYLTTVVQNLGRDYRTSRWGRWRPTAAAERLGLVAVQLEALMDRDGFSLDEASEMLRANHGVRMTRLELAELAARLPQRVRLRFEVSDEVAAATSAAGADRGVEETEWARLLEEARRALEACLAELDVEDRLLLQMHYQSGLTISAIAAALDLRQRPLYGRRDRCHRQLKACLERGGPDAGAVLDALGWAGAEAHFEVDYGLENPEAGRTEPSNSTSVGDEEER